MIFDEVLLVTMIILMGKGSKKDIALFYHYDCEANNNLTKKTVKIMMNNIFIICG